MDRTKIKGYTKKIAFLGIGIALYVVLGLIINIPLLAGTHLQTDLGYIAFSIFLLMFGWQAAIVGVVGCLVESLITSGWVPYGWLVGQLFIGVACGLVYTKTNKKWLHVIVTVASVFIGIVGIKTVIECAMFGIPLAVKAPKNLVAFIADAVPMVAGLFIGYPLRRRFRNDSISL